MYIFHNLYSSGVELCDRLWCNTITEDLSKRAGEKKLQIVNCASCVSKDDDALQFLIGVKEKKKPRSLTRFKRKIKNTPTNLDLLSNLVSECAHYPCIHKRLHSSWPRVVTKSF